MFTLHKPGQGFYTRTMSAIALAVLGSMAVMWLWDLLANVKFLGRYEPVYGQMTMAIIVFVVLGLFGWLLIGTRPRPVEFLIATEGEMKKVNWSTRKEVTGSTTLVIAFTFFIALLCFLLDLMFQMLFQAMHVLEKA
jgi:preprotein translocase SecE subunit